MEAVPDRKLEPMRRCTNWLARSAGKISCSNCNFLSSGSLPVSLVWFLMPAMNACVLRSR